MIDKFSDRRLKSKLPETPISIFSQMTALANQYGAVNLSQGFPDFETDPILISLVTGAMKNGHNQYAPMAGVLTLRQAIAQKFYNLYQAEVDAEAEITITTGGTQALFTAIAAVVHAGDEVIIFEPAYDSYKPTVEVFGGLVVPIQLVAPSFTINWDEVESTVTAKTRLIIINNPNNPTATVFSANDLIRLEQIVAHRDIYVLSDEVYEHLIYDQQQHQSVIQSELLRSRSFIVASFGKLLHTTGWKLGYVIAPKYLTVEFRKIHQFNVFSANTPMQYAIASYISQADRYLNLAPFFQEKRDLLIAGLKQTKLEVLPCKGTYFLLVNYAQTSDMDELSFAKYVTQHYQVAMVPISPFYSSDLNQKLLRICFAKERDTLLRGIENLSKL